MLALAALIRCLVIDGLRRLEEHPELATGDPGNHWLATENKSLAARYGLRAQCVREPGLPRRALSEDLDVLLESLQPIAHEAGESDFLLPFYGMDRFECGADRQRRLYRQTGDWRPVLDDMKGRWVHELEEAAIEPVAARATSSLDESDQLPCLPAERAISAAAS